MELTRRNVVGSIVMIIGFCLLVGAAETGDLKALRAADAGLASGNAVWLMLFAGSFLFGAGAFILNKKGGASGRQNRRVRRF